MVVDSFDSEQIWAELVLQNDSMSKFLARYVKHMLNAEPTPDNDNEYVYNDAPMPLVPVNMRQLQRHALMVAPNLADDADESADASDESNDDDDDDENEEFVNENDADDDDDDSAEDIPVKRKYANDDTDDDDDDDDGQDEDDDRAEPTEEDRERLRKARAAMNDEFFDLDEMEAFVEEVEQDDAERFGRELDGDSDGEDHGSAEDEPDELDDEQAASDYKRRLKTNQRNNAIVRGAASSTARKANRPATDDDDNDFDDDRKEGGDFDDFDDEVEDEDADLDDKQLDELAKNATYDDLFEPPEKATHVEDNAFDVEARFACRIVIGGVYSLLLKTGMQ